MAQDGEDALRKMEECPADIVLTDINMPYISGVELMEQLKSRWPETAILVLSGYSDFEYVHKALLCGALDYVLKPLNRSKLMEALSRAIEQVLAKSRRQRERSEEQARLNLAASMVLDREFSQWLHDARRQELLQSVEAKLYDYEAAFSSYRVVLVRLPGFMQHLGEGELPTSAAEAVYKIKMALASWIRTGNKLVVHDLYHANHFLIITETDEQELRRMLEAALTEIEVLSGVAPRALVSEGYFSFRDLRKAYDQTRRCISSMACGAGMKIGYAADLREVPALQRIGADMVRQLEQAARAQQRERFERLLDQSGIYRCCE